jgi:hypothetical protein
LVDLEQILTEEELIKDIIRKLDWPTYPESSHHRYDLEQLDKVIKESKKSLLSANAELSFKNMKLKEKDAKVTEFMDWAKRIIDSGMGAGILKYEPVQFFIEYHTYLKSLEETK